MGVAIYTRVSTGSQTTENQLRELKTVAERHGWQVVAKFTDEGISGAKGRDQRPGLNSLMEGVMRRDFDKVMAWSVDRLGRSLSDLLTEFESVRKSTIALLGSLDPQVEARAGIANKHPVTVRALAYVIAGHAQHHLERLRGCLKAQVSRG